MADLPRDASAEEQYRWAIAHETECRARKDSEARRYVRTQDIDERLKALEREMVTRSQLQTTVDRAADATHEKIDDLTATVKESTETITLALREIPVQDHRISSLEKTMDGQQKDGKATAKHSGSVATWLGSIIGAVVAAAVWAYNILTGGEP